MVQLKFLPKGVEDFVPHHRRFPTKGFHGPGESITLYSKRRGIFDLSNLDTFLVLTRGEHYTVHGKICYQHRHGVFLYERCIFVFIREVGLQQQQGCRGRMPLARIPAGTPARKAFSFPAFASLSKKILFFLKCNTKCFVFSYLFLLYFQFILSG